MTAHPLIKKTILVVEDEKPLARLLSDLLRKSGEYEVEVAYDGREALEKLEARKFSYDLVLTDLMMPRMSGDQLIAEALARKPSLGFVVLTANKSEEKVIRLLRLGALDYLVKPVKMEELLRTVRHAIDRARRTPADIGGMDVRSEVRGWVEITAPTHYEFIERFEKFTALLGQIPLSREDRENVRLAVAELGQNAVEWGNRGDASKFIHLSYCVFADRIIFKIEDEGEGFDPDALRDPSVDPIAHLLAREQEGKRPGGYGIFLTRKIMDEVLYNTKGNVVLMTKLFSKPTSAGGRES